MNSANINYRVGIDVGSYSIGMATIPIDDDGKPTEILSAISLSVLPSSTSLLVPKGGRSRSLRNTRTRFTRGGCGPSWPPPLSPISKSWAKSCPLPCAISPAPGVAQPLQQGHCPVYRGGTIRCLGEHSETVRNGIGAPHPANHHSGPINSQHESGQNKASW